MILQQYCSIKLMPLCLAMETPLLEAYLGKAFLSLEAEFYFVLHSCDPAVPQ